jgi:hypothetical protein
MTVELEQLMSSRMVQNSGSGLESPSSRSVLRRKHTSYCDNIRLGTCEKSWLKTAPGKMGAAVPIVGAVRIVISQP